MKTFLATALLLLSFFPVKVSSQNHHTFDTWSNLGFRRLETILPMTTKEVLRMIEKEGNFRFAEESEVTPYLEKISTYYPGKRLLLISDHPEIHAIIFHKEVVDEKEKRAIITAKGIIYSEKAEWTSDYILILKPID